MCKLCILINTCNNYAQIEMSFLILTKLIIYYLKAALYMLLPINKICCFQFFRVYVSTNFKVDVLFVLFAVM